MEHIEKIKQEIIQSAIAKKEEFEAVSAYIFQNPELGFEEVKAQKVLCDCLEKHGFQVTRGLGTLPTAFEAVFQGKKEGKTFVFMAEYDCLPTIGHGCGHNIMGASAIGAAVVLKEAMEKYDLGGTLKVIGTPAEENGSGKCVLLREGFFEGVDAAMVMHPTNESIPDDISFASINLEFTFHGKAAHSAAFPWKGVNALNGVIQMFNAVDSARLHFKDYTRVHGIITNGGTAHNTIPDKAVALFNVRALEYDYMMEVVKMVKQCAQGAALCTGTTVDIEQKGEIIKDVRNNQELVSFVRNNMEFVKEPYIERDLTQGIGSTDVGNVTHELPAIQFYIQLAEDVGTHTIEFAEAAGGEAGKRTLHASIQVLAMSGLDFMTK